MDDSTKPDAVVGSEERRKVKVEGGEFHTRNIVYAEMVARRWRAFDAETINREMRSLPVEDFHRLTAAMLAYRLESQTGFVVKNYGEGLMMVKDSSTGQGRCLFFSVSVEKGNEVLTALLVYKKESQEAPSRVISAARSRMRNFEDK